LDNFLNSNKNGFGYILGDFFANPFEFITQHTGVGFVLKKFADISLRLIAAQAL
jgi:hypothetical protein